MASSKATPSRKKSSAEDTKPTASVTSFAPSAVIAREEEIRRRAYEFYLARGGHDGAAEEDWLRAEEEVTQTNGKRTA